MKHPKKNVLLLSLPFAGTAIPSIQLAILESYLKKREINIKTRHLYLKAAEFIGLNNYNFLIYVPNDSYTAQMIFSKYVFPDHWEKLKDKFREYFNERVAENREIQKTFTFESYIHSIDKFYSWVIENVDWKSYDIIGFTLNYGQFLPSLAVAKKVKGLYPEKKIIFGGSRTTGDLGRKVLKAFNYLDFIVSGEGEESLYLLALNYQNYRSIPGLIYRNGKDIIWNKSETVVDLNNSPTPTYDSFYKELKLTSEETRQYFVFFGRLPIEISRGCWWNRCSFCNLNLQHSKYKEKNIDKIVEEIKFLSEKYEMLNFQIVGNTLPKKDYITLFKKIKKLDKNFTFFSEARADQLKSEDYKLLKEAGFTTLQIGIEAFSQNYLKKINKGVRVIDNIAALKFCRENRINLRYNIIVNYPNEEGVDFEETKKNIQLIKKYIDPPQLSFLMVGFGCPIYNRPEDFNIEKLDYTNIDKIMFPREFLEKRFNYFYNFKRKKDLVKNGNDWQGLVREWKKDRKKLIRGGMERQTTLDKLIFYYVDGGSFLKIYDKRKSDNIRIYILDKLERKIFLSCTNITTFKKLQEEFTNTSSEKLADILKRFEENRIVLREKDSYLSLPLCYSISL